MRAVGTTNGMKPELLDPVESSEFLRGGKLRNSREPPEMVCTRPVPISSDSESGDGTKFGFGESSPFGMLTVNSDFSADNKFSTFPMELRTAGDGCAGPNGLEKDVSDNFRSRSLRDTT